MGEIAKIMRSLRTINLHKEGLFIIASVKRFAVSSKWAVLFVFIVYCVGVASLVLANVEYLDDMHRMENGFFKYNWSRYTSNTLGYILNLNSDFNLNFFPYTLFIALFFLSLASCALVYIIDKNLIKNKIALLASVPLGLSPYFLENLSYNFDSPFMDLSVLVSIFPFIFLRKKVAFIIISIICLWLMLTSYQSSSGIYIMLAVFLCF